MLMEEKQMNKINVYSEEEFETYKGVCCGLNRITDKKLARTLPKGLCYWCEKNKARFPTERAIKEFNIEPKQSIMCENCFLTPITDKLKIIEKFGSIEINISLSEEQKENNQQKAKEILEKIKIEPLKFASNYEPQIIKAIKKGGEFCKFFEDN